MFSIEKFSEYECFFQKDHLNSFELLPGIGNIIISAPHSVEQTRNNKIKYAEVQSGVLAKMLHDSLRCPVIYKTKNCNDDANFDEESTYKDSLAQYIKKNNIRFLLDLHQLAPSRIEQIDIGTGNLNNISRFEFINVILKAFTQRKIGIVQIDKLFDASYPYTISSYIRRVCGISCIQIEMNSNLIRLETKESLVSDVFHALKDIIINIEEILDEEEV